MRTLRVCVSMSVCVCVCIYMYTFATRLRTETRTVFSSETSSSTTISRAKRKRKERTNFPIIHLSIRHTFPHFFNPRPSTLPNFLHTPFPHTWRERRSTLPRRILHAHLPHSSNTLEEARDEMIGCDDDVRLAPTSRRGKKAIVCFVPDDDDSAIPLPFVVWIQRSGFTHFSPPFTKETNSNVIAVELKEEEEEEENDHKISIQPPPLLVHRSSPTGRN